MGMIIEYFRYQKEYEEKYGEKTIVLMQVGAFYEIYGYDVTYCLNEEGRKQKDKKGKVKKIWNESIGHAYEMSVILNCVLSQENLKETYSIDNPHKVGFPMIAYEKNLATLMANNYVVVRIDQLKEKNARGKVERIVAEIQNPLMQMDNVTDMTNNVVCIYIEYHGGMNKNNKFDNLLVTTGVAVIDILTGQNRVCEYNSKREDEVHAIQELYRFLISHYPNEIIIYLNDMPKQLSETEDNPYIRYLDKSLELGRFKRVTKHINKVDENYKKIQYQTDFLNKLYSSKTTNRCQINIIQERNSKIIQDVGLDTMTYGRIAYILLMQYCYSYNGQILSKLEKPDLQWLDEHRHLILTHNAIIQLDLIPQHDKNSNKKEINSLLSILDENRTNLGKRLLYNLLHNPLFKTEDIESYYNMTDEMRHQKIGDDDLWLVLDRLLKELPDISRLQRKLEVKLITPKELSILYSGYLKIINIYTLILNTNSPELFKNLLSENYSTNFNNFIVKFSSLINFKLLETCNIYISESGNKWMEFNEFPINQGIYQEIDEKCQNLLATEKSLKEITDHLQYFISTKNSRHGKFNEAKSIEFKSAKKKRGAVKQDPSGYLLILSNSKASVLMREADKLNHAICGKIYLEDHNSGEKIIKSDIINQLCEKITTIKTWIKNNLMTIYESVIDDMINNFNFYKPLTDVIAKIDLVHSYAKISYKYNYYRPNLIENSDGNSFLTAKNIRHPIIERLIDGAYVTNDVSLGLNDESPLGMLIFGVNSAGKTSLSKAVALNVIMAQAGCFTPSYLTLKPFSKIITRLPKSDNLFKGESSFQVEMSELRTILRQSDSSTLVIGDELCNGTESNSAMAMITSSILFLLQQKTKFMFATHLHELLNISHIKNIPSTLLNISHLSITHHEESNIIVYDRKLNPGPGKSTYGLMVAKSLALPIDFLQQASEILLEITHENKHFFNPVTSRYNSDLYIDCCAICRKTQHSSQLDTHHINHQSNANQYGLIGNMHKNKKDNLIVLCKNCHSRLHSTNSDLKIIETTIGNLVVNK